MASFLESLRQEDAARFGRIAERAAPSECAAFGDLLWDDDVDLDALLKDPGILFETARRMFALSRIQGEVRYYAGPNGSEIGSSDYDYELGILDNVCNALQLAEEYLVNGKDLREIEVPRRIRWARKPSIPGSKVAREKVDTIAGSLLGVTGVSGVIASTESKK